MYINIIANRPLRVWLTLNVLDLLLTIGIIKLGGAEVMPIAGWFLNMGMVWFVAFKLLFALGAGVVLLNISKWATKFCNWAMGIIVGFNFLSLVMSVALR